MGLVLYALKFRITFRVMAILILPSVNIPVVTIVWTCTNRLDLHRS